MSRKNIIIFSIITLLIGTPARAGFGNFTLSSLSDILSPLVLPQVSLSIEKQEGLNVTINGGTGPITAGVYRLTWDWGDGTIRQGWFPQSYTYQQKGRYSVRVTAQGLFGGTSAVIEVDTRPQLPPLLDLSKPQINGLSVEINGYTERAEKLIWDWGDGADLQESWFPAKHTYTQYGTYNIITTAVGNGGVNAKQTSQVKIQVPVPPKISLGAPHINGLAVQVNGYVENADQLLWNWGDGTPDKISWFPALHTYGTQGTYVIKVTAIGGGLSAVKNLTVSVPLIKSSCPAASTVTPPASVLPPVAVPCIADSVALNTSRIVDTIKDVGTEFIDIQSASMQQVNEDYLQMDMRLGTADIPFHPNIQNYLWFLDTDSTRSGNEFIIRLNAISGSGVTNTWHMWIESLLEGGRGIYHFPAAKFSNTFSVLVPLKLLYNPFTIAWHARAEYQTSFDETTSATYTLNYARAYPNPVITTNASPILQNGAYFNNLSKGGAINFSLAGGGSADFFSSYEKRLCQTSKNNFQGNGSGLSMVFARVNGCYLVPQPLIIANGNFTLEGTNTAFVFNTAKAYDATTVGALDVLSSIQKKLVGLYPHNGQLIIAEESDSNVLASPNTEFPIPVPLFVPFDPNMSWFYFTHEYGHHFHGGAVRMPQLFQDFYAESIPSVIAYYAMEEVVKNPSAYSIPSGTAAFITDNLTATKNNFLADLATYESQGAPFSKLSVWPPVDFDPNNVYNGMILRIQGTYGRGVVENFFKIFQPPEELLTPSLLLKIQPLNQNQKHTAFAAAWSVAAGGDLRPLFYGWNYPIDEAYYTKIYPELATLLASAGGDGIPTSIQIPSSSPANSLFQWIKNAFGF